MKDLIREKFSAYDISLTDSQVEKFNKYFDLLIEWNGKMNLTAITEPEEVVIKHFVDSCLPYKSIKNGAKVLDLGAGAGFPSIPLKILRNDLHMCMVDSLNKRVGFLNTVISEIGLLNCVAIHARGEDLARDSSHRENYDVVASRAVARMSTLLEYTSPFVFVGGKVLCYKAQSLDEELEESKGAQRVLNLKLDSILDFTLQEYNAIRRVAVFTKVKSTPKTYPRGQNRAKQQPL